MSDNADDITIMTREEHDRYVAAGCDPHCHVCDKKINVGDRWKLQLFVHEVVAPNGLVSRVRGMCCKKCVQSGRDLPPTERARLEAGLRSLSDGRVAPPQPAAAPMARSRHGCFVLDDGTKF